MDIIGVFCRAGQLIRRGEETPLRKNDAINDVDHSVAGFYVRKNNVSGAAVRVGKNAAALGEESTFKGADP